MEVVSAESPAVVRWSATRFWLSWLLGLLAMAIALAVAAPHDLAVTHAVARPGSAFGFLIARFGEWPGIAAVIVSFALVLGGRRRRPWRRHVPVAVALLALAALHPLAMTQLLKWLWGRSRPDALGVADMSYTPFYRPVGLGAGRSFPSGHVAISSVFFPIAFAARGWIALPIWLGALGYPVLVAAGRVIEQRHFLCDTLFALLSALLMAPLLLRWAHRRLHQGAPAR